MSVNPIVFVGAAAVVVFSSLALLKLKAANKQPGAMDLQSRMNPSEPTSTALFGVLQRVALLVPSAAVGVIFLVPYLLGLAVYGRPPIVPSPSAFGNMFYLCLFKMCRERNYLSYKVRLFLYFLQTLFLQPAYGVLWFLDDVLFPGYRAVKIVEPCFIIGDARTGTTQYVQILGDDAKNFCAPITLNALIPFMHAWKIGTFLKSFMTASMVEKAEEFAESLYFSFLPKEFQTRHEGGLWRPDTFEVQYNSWRVEFFVQLIDMNLTAENWWFPMEEQRADFLRFIDAIWKKVAYHRGVPGQKMLIKGHFLIECPALEKMYPGAYFVALAREPEPRLMSQINFLWVGPWHALAGVPQTVLKDLTKVLVNRVCEYSEQERMFFSESSSNKAHARRLSIPFEGYVKEIDVSIKNTYSLCDIAVPATVETRLAEHAEEHRHWTQTRVKHSPDFTLDELGVDRVALAKRHEKYLPRCVLPPTPKKKGNK